MMQANPVAQMMQLLQSGKNPEAVLQILAQNNPQARQFLQMTGGKSRTELQRMVENMCKERGTTVEEVARSLGIQIPSNR